jgi:glycine/D-amino acid oxidase-like deaminating enzyme
MTPPRLRLRTGRPVWLGPSEARRAPAHRPLTGRLRVDVAIVGGGITGAIAALRFAEAGIGVAVLEADRIGHGSTAASSALLLQEPDQRLLQLTDRYGARMARTIWRLSQDAAGDLLALLEGLPRPCGFGRRDTVYYTTDAGDVEPLRREHAERRRAGIAAEWLTPRALREQAGIPGRAGIRTRGNAQCDPYRACLGVMDAARRAGAVVFERTPVRRIESRRRAVHLRTPAGVVEARQVVIATGYATRQFRPLAGRFALCHTYVLATPPLDVRARRELGLADVMLWDSRPRYHYARWTEDHRLLLGGGDRPIAGGRRPAKRLAAAVRDVRAHFEQVLPALGELRIAQAWEGRFANTADGLPYVGPHSRYPGHLFALGYGGNGMTFGSLAGRLLVEHWRGRSTREHALFAFGR